MSLENQFINTLLHNHNISSFLKQNPLIFIEYFFNTNTVFFRKLSKTFEVIYNTDELYFISILKIINKYINETNVNTFIKIFTIYYNIELFETVCDYIKYPELKKIYFYELLKNKTTLILDDKTYYFLKNIIDFNKLYLCDHFTILQRQILLGNYNIVKLILNNHTILDNINNSHCTRYLLYIMYPNLLNKKDLDIYKQLEYITTLLSTKESDIEDKIKDIDVSLKDYNLSNNVSLIAFVTDSKLLYKLINKGCDFSNYDNRILLNSKHKLLLIENGIYMEKEYFTEKQEKIVYDNYKKQLYNTFIENNLLIKDIVNDILNYI
jgi:hypothetical protein